MTAYYNEIDPYCAQWLRNLIAAGHIAPGVVDERDIREVTHSDLKGFTQCHFFAGIGLWSYALRLAGWPDSRPVWTGSCPCQPFSVAGKGGKFEDPRHLWPEFYRLIRGSRPPKVFGEQVAGPDGLLWYDLVQDDLEAESYSVRARDICAAGVGAPIIRQRLWWMASAGGEGLEGRSGRSMGNECQAAKRGSSVGRVGGTNGGRCAEGDCTAQGLGYRNTSEPDGGPDRLQSTGEAKSFWADADWLGCRDGRFRPVEPGTFPLAHGDSAGVGRVRADQERKAQGSRVGRLRGYGNAIVPQVAAAFISTYMDEAREPFSRRHENGGKQK